MSPAANGFIVEALVTGTPGYLATWQPGSGIDDEAG